jgi:hypothetical protein
MPKVGEALAAGEGEAVISGGVGEAAPGRRLTASAISAAETIEFRVNFIFMRYQLVTWSMEAPFENFVS